MSFSRSQGWKVGSLGVFLLLGPALQGLAGLPSLALTLLHVLFLAGSGWAVARLGGWPQPRDPMDRIALCFLQGWVAVPLFLAVDWLTGSRLHPAWPFAGLLLAAAGRPRLSRVEVSVPAWIYVLALAYAGWSVALPFRFFHEASIAREMFSDGVQRFGVVQALAAHVPPDNPFASGLSLRYYWFGFLPLGLERRMTGASLFDLWRMAQSGQAFWMLPALWWITRRVFCARVATFALLAGFFCASFEWLASPALAPALAAWNGAPGEVAGVREALRVLRASDPDQVVGVATRYSDQLYAEDFLYIPQNAAALGLLVLGFWLLQERHPRSGVLTLSLLAGFNTFFLPPASAALGLWLAWTQPARRGGRLAALFLGASVAGLAACRILPLPLPPLLAAVALLLLVPWPPVPPAPIAPRRLAGLAGCTLAALLAVIATAPGLRLATLLLNYGPAFPLALAGLVLLMRSRSNESAPTFLVLLAGFCLAQHVLTVGLGWQREPDAPAVLQAWSARAGQLIDYFNFYHKTAKGLRWAWCVLGALALARALACPRRPAARRLIALGAACLALPALGTTLWRPLTYLRVERPPESRCAAYLRAHGADHRTVVLAEDFAHTRIGQLTGVTLYGFSMEGVPLAARAGPGAWLKQYVAPAERAEVDRRLRLLQTLFAGDPDPAQLQEVVKAQRVRYLLLSRRRDLDPPAHLVMEEPGASLYACEAE